VSVVVWHTVDVVREGAHNSICWWYTHC